MFLFEVGVGSGCVSFLVSFDIDRGSGYRDFNKK